MTFSVTPIAAGFLQRVRTTGRDDLNQPVRQLRASGGEPCRDTLRRARPGERLLLASYCPFQHAGPYREYGAVYVLAEPSALHGAPPGLDVQGGPDDYWKRDAPLALRAYSAAEDIVAAQLLRPASLAAAAADYFARDDIDFALVRFAAYGCYALRLDRTTEQ
ncbi:DUF1203 domain-containing protein [Microbulbifer sp. SAOS-129_SWC]|uniref:DUF1203 domain-containing protein n=1 Tax=Microbulbifer sp. SAOS-129_SWC TaxID=3145235 RepID=UPI0032164157